MTQRYEESQLFRQGQLFLRIGTLLSDPKTTIKALADFEKDTGINVRVILQKPESQHE